MTVGWRSRLGRDGGCRGSSMTLKGEERGGLCGCGVRRWPWEFVCVGGGGGVGNVKVEPGKGGEGSAGENEGRLTMDIELDISPNVRWEEFVSLLVLFPQRRGQGLYTLLWLRWLSVIVERAHLNPLCVLDARVTGSEEGDVGLDRQSEYPEKLWWRWWSSKLSRRKW